jgi:hypothetical protein
MHRIKYLFRNSFHNLPAQKMHKNISKMCNRQKKKNKKAVWAANAVCRLRWNWKPHNKIVIFIKLSHYYVTKCRIKQISNLITPAVYNTNTTWKVKKNPENRRKTKCCQFTNELNKCTTIFKAIHSFYVTCICLTHSQCLHLSA